MSDMSDTRWARLGRLVVKQGLGIGALPPADRVLLLALAWSCLPDEVLSERQINDRLRSQLAGPLACLDTDHVELRRWLVDGAWLQRDGFGREYRRASPAQLQHPPALAAAQALAELDGRTWVAQQQAAHQALRASRRLAWQAGTPGSAGNAA